MKIDRQSLAKAAPFLIAVIAALAGLHSKEWSDIALELMFPVRRTYGGLALPLRVLPRGPQSQPAPAAQPPAESLLLIQQSNQELATLDILAADATGHENVAAGANCEPPPRMLPLTETAAGSARMMEIDLPQKTLLTIVIADPTANHDIAPSKRFTYQHGSTRKEFTGDLEIRTESETTRMWIVGMIATLSAAGLGYATGRRNIAYPSGPVAPIVTPAREEVDEG